MKQAVQYAMNFLLSPTHALALGRDLLALRTYRTAFDALFQPDTDSRHLEAVMDWLCRAQDVTGCGGVSAGYHLFKNWLPPYPETTGYIIPTFLRYARRVGQPSFASRAVRMGDWEIDIQLPCGAVRGGVGVNDHPVVFNSGQVILGWVALFKETGEERFRTAAVRAGDWLVSVQEPDGSWIRHSYNGVPHVYYTHVAWPLAELHGIASDARYLDAAARNLSWAAGQCRENGWFDHCGFETATHNAPLTHTIAYTWEGLWEGARFIDPDLADRIRACVRTAADSVLHIYEARKPDPYTTPNYMAGTYDCNWKSEDRYSCLTGNAQIAIVWLHLFEATGDLRYVNAALKMLDHVKRTQSLRSVNGGIRGGIAGSYPLWGGYSWFTYPNWAACFFAEALMFQERIVARLEDSAQ